MISKEFPAPREVDRYLYTLDEMEQTSRIRVPAP